MNYGLLDYHLHSSSFSGDSRVSMEEHCRLALGRGAPEIGFAEHLEFDPDDDGFRFFDRGRFRAELERCRALFDGRLLLRAGVEVTYQREYRKEIEKTLAGLELDFVIGSVHLVAGGNMSDPSRAGDYFLRRGPRQAYAEYFELLAEAAGSGLFDILGHLDVAKKFGVLFYGPFRYAEHTALVDPVLREAARTGMALEVNASGLRQAPRETYPTVEALRRFRELGGERVTLGSDGHVAAHSGWGLEEAARAAREAGFTEVTAFERRIPRGVPLP